jgi:hypothetical protein
MARDHNAREPGPAAIPVAAARKKSLRGHGTSGSAAGASRFAVPAAPLKKSVHFLPDGKDPFPSDPGERELGARGEAENCVDAIEQFLPAGIETPAPAFVHERVTQGDDEPHRGGQALMRDVGAPSDDRVECRAGCAAAAGRLIGG